MLIPFPCPPIVSICDRRRASWHLPDANTQTSESLGAPPPPARLRAPLTRHPIPTQVHTRHVPYRAGCAFFRADVAGKEGNQTKDACHRRVSVAEAEGGAPGPRAEHALCVPRRFTPAGPLPVRSRNKLLQHNKPTQTAGEACTANA
jgi:hypothetical protein